MPLNCDNRSPHPIAAAPDECASEDFELHKCGPVDWCGAYLVWWAAAAVHEIGVTSQFALVVRKCLKW